MRSQRQSSSSKPTRKEWHCTWHDKLAWPLSPIRVTPAWYDQLSIAPWSIVITSCRPGGRASIMEVICIMLVLNASQQLVNHMAMERWDLSAALRSVKTAPEGLNRLPLHCTVRLCHLVERTIDAWVQPL